VCMVSQSISESLFHYLVFFLGFETTHTSTPVLLRLQSMWNLHSLLPSPSIPSLSTAMRYCVHYNKMMGRAARGALLVNLIEFTSLLVDLSLSRKLGLSDEQIADHCQNDIRVAAGREVGTGARDISEAGDKQ
jgi:hypothetical protein